MSFALMYILLGGNATDHLCSKWKKTHLIFFNSIYSPAHIIVYKNVSNTSYLEKF